MVKKIANKVVEEVNETAEEFTREANEVAGVITFKRWQVAVAALAVTVLLLVVIL